MSRDLILQNAKRLAQDRPLDFTEVWVSHVDVSANINCFKTNKTKKGQPNCCHYNFSCIKYIFQQRIALYISSAE